MTEWSGGWKARRRSELWCSQRAMAYDSTLEQLPDRDP